MTIVLLTILAASVVLPGHGDASHVPELLSEHVCKADVKKFCSDAPNAVKILECLQDHEQDLSEDCLSGLHRCPMYNCIDDVKRLCPDADGTKQTLVCLWKHRAQLSDKCWNQSIPVTKIGFLPESHACRDDEHKFCSNEESLLGTMSCLQQPKLKLALSSQCSRIVQNCQLFACVTEAQQTCPDITTIKDLKGCIIQHNLHCVAPQPESDQDHDADSVAAVTFPACELEAEQFCHNVGPEGIYDCLHKHDDSVSKQCKASLKSSLENRCKQERNNFCRNQFGKDLVDCLSQVESVSMKCQRALVVANGGAGNVPGFHDTRLSSDEMLAPDHRNHADGLNLLLACLSSVAFIVTLVGLAYVVRKYRTASLSMDGSLPSVTTTTEYIRI